MTIYVDPIFTSTATARTAQARSHSNSWAHLRTDGTPEELHEFAAKLGLKREWAQNEGSPWGLHHDLVPSKRAAAVKLGAVEVTTHQMAKTTIRIREANTIALQRGPRLMSTYTIRDTTTVWIITEWDRSATTILLPDEY